MTKQKLAGAFFAIALLAAGVLLGPYAPNLLEDPDDMAGQPTVRLAELATGSYVEIELPASRVFVLRDFDEQVYVFSVPYSDAAYWLPEFDWSHPAIPCARFEPDQKDGALIPDGMFRCVLPDHGEFFRYEHAWSYSGKNQGYRTSDLKVADYEVVDDMIVLSRWK